MQISTSFPASAIGTSQRFVSVGDAFDGDGDVLVDVVDSRGATYQSAATFLDLGGARQLRDHLTGLLGENLAWLLDEPAAESERPAAATGPADFNAMNGNFHLTRHWNGFVGLDFADNDGQHTCTNVRLDQARILRDALIAADLGDRG